MKIIDGTNATLGRLASYVAKEAMKGEEVAIVNCGQVIITGNKVNIKKELEERRTKVGSGQKGPKVSRTAEKIVKRAIRGMLPNHRMGRGKEALKRIKCYVGVPEQFQNKEKITSGKQKKLKFSRVEDFAK
jgi:large subunit ribosomal protein L13